MKCSKCGRFLCMPSEKATGQCGVCTMAEMPPEQRDAINKLIGAAFTGANIAKVERLVDNAMESMRKDDQ